MNNKIITVAGMIFAVAFIGVLSLLLTGLVGKGSKVGAEADANMQSSDSYSAIGIDGRTFSGAEVVRLLENVPYSADPYSGCLGCFVIGKDIKGTQKLIAVSRQKTSSGRIKLATHTGYNIVVNYSFSSAPNSSPQYKDGFTREQLENSEYRYAAYACGKYTVSSSASSPKKSSLSYIMFVQQ